MKKPQAEAISKGLDEAHIELLRGEYFSLSPLIA